MCLINKKPLINKMRGKRIKYRSIYKISNQLYLMKYINITYHIHLEYIELTIVFFLIYL